MALALRESWDEYVSTAGIREWSQQKTDGRPALRAIGTNLYHWLETNHSTTL